MFIAIKIVEKHGSFYEHINVTHITRTSFVNSKNPDAGTKIFLRTGDELVTSYPMDIISLKIEEAWKEAAMLILVNIIAEKSKLEKIDTDFIMTHDEKDD